MAVLRPSLLGAGLLLHRFLRRGSGLERLARASSAARVSPPAQQPADEDQHEHQTSSSAFACAQPLVISPTSNMKYINDHQDQAEQREHFEI